VVKIKEYSLHTFLSDFLNNESVVFDLGANEGEFSDYIAKNFGCSVFAVEPIPALFKKIETNNLIKKFQYCINGDGRECELYLEPEKCATAYKVKSGKKIKAEGKTLKQFLDEAEVSHIDLLKIDIEGAEVELFESIEEETLQKIDQITVEFHDFLWSELHGRVEAIKKSLSKRGFYSIPFSLRTNGDVLFVKRGLIKKTTYWFLKYVLRYIMRVSRKLNRLFENSYHSYLLFS